jgi:translation initiation factor 2D
MVAKGGMRGAWERRVEAMKSDVDVDEGRFCEVLCIHGDL